MEVSRRGRGLILEGVQRCNSFVGLEGYIERSAGRGGIQEEVSESWEWKDLAETGMRSFCREMKTSLQSLRGRGGVPARL